MGKARLTCSGGCACQPSEIDAHSPSSPDRPRVSVTAVQRVAVTLLTSPSASPSSAPSPSASPSSPPSRVSNQSARLEGTCCQLRLQIENTTASGEHKFKLLALLLAEAGARDRWQPPGVKVGASRVLHMIHGAAAEEVEEQRKALHPPLGRSVGRSVGRSMGRSSGAKGRGGKGKGGGGGGGRAGAGSGRGDPLAAQNRARMRELLRKHGHATRGPDAVLMQRVLALAEGQPLLRQQTGGARDPVQAAVAGKA